MKVLILEDVFEHQVRLERILDEKFRKNRIFQYHKTTREKSVNLKNTLNDMK